MRLALVPLDERPVNVQIPLEVAAIAGAELELPPARALPAFRTPADLDELRLWLARTGADPNVGGAVVCTDTLVFGGIIPARISDQGMAESVERLEVLRQLAGTRPELRITAVSLVMRASDSYSAVEEPEYWSDFGRELHSLGGELHRDFETDAAGEFVARKAVRSVPEGVVRDFELRRLRNHVVNLAAVGLHEEGVLETLAITADDTAPHSAGSAEQAWLRHWQRALPSGRSILTYPGADEVGAVLVARALVGDLRQPVISVVCGEVNGLDRVPNFENVPLRESIARQIGAVGGRVAAADESADITLVAHAADPAGGDYFGSRPASDPDAIAATLDAVRRALNAGEPVALADVRFSNGSDPELVDTLAAQGLLLRLSSYAGWNTAGNSIGSALAHAVARWAGEQTGTLDADAAERALVARIVEDRGYQSGIRARIQSDILGGSITPAEPGLVAAASEAVRAGLQDYLETLAPGEWVIGQVTLPWNRSFEIGLSLVRASG